MQSFYNYQKLIVMNLSRYKHDHCTRMVSGGGMKFDRASPISLEEKPVCSWEAERRETDQAGDRDGRPVGSAHEEPPQDHLVEGSIRATGQEPVQLLRKPEGWLDISHKIRLIVLYLDDNRYYYSIVCLYLPWPGASDRYPGSLAPSCVPYGPCCAWCRLPL